MSGNRTLVDQIDRMTSQGYRFDSIDLMTLLAWHGEQMAMQRRIDAQTRIAEEQGNRALQLEQKCISLQAEITALRAYGNKDCTAMADEFLGQVAWKSADLGKAPA